MIPWDTFKSNQQVFRNMNVNQSNQAQSSQTPKTQAMKAQVESSHQMTKFQLKLKSKIPKIRAMKAQDK